MYPGGLCCVSYIAIAYVFGQSSGMTTRRPDASSAAIVVESAAKS